MELKKLIKARGWSIQQLAERMTDKNGVVGVTQSSASQIINGNPTLKKLEEIAGIMGLPVWELLRDEAAEEAAAVPVVTCPCCGAVLRVSLIPDDALGDEGACCTAGEGGRGITQPGPPSSP